MLVSFWTVSKCLSVHLPWWFLGQHICFTNKKDAPHNPTPPSGRGLLPVQVPIPYPECSQGGRSWTERQMPGSSPRALWPAPPRALLPRSLLLLPSREGPFQCPCRAPPGPGGAAGVLHHQLPQRPGRGGTGAPYPSSPEGTKCSPEIPRRVALRPAQKAPAFWRVSITRPGWGAGPRAGTSGQGRRLGPRTGGTAAEQAGAPAPQQALHLPPNQRPTCRPCHRPSAASLCRPQSSSTLTSPPSTSSWGRRCARVPWSTDGDTRGPRRGTRRRNLRARPSDGRRGLPAVTAKARLGSAGGSGAEGVPSLQAVTLAFCLIFAF